MSTNIQRRVSNVNNMRILCVCESVFAVFGWRAWVWIFEYQGRPGTCVYLRWVVFGIGPQIYGVFCFCIVVALGIVLSPSTFSGCAMLSTLQILGKILRRSLSIFESCLIFTASGCVGQGCGRFFSFR